MNKHMNTDPSLHMEDDSLPSLRPHGEAEFQSREAGKGNVLTNQRRGKCGLCVFCLLFVSLLFSALLFSDGCSERPDAGRSKLSLGKKKK